MILRSTDVRSALRARQRGFILNPFRFGVAPPPTDPYWASVVLSMPMDGSNNGTTFTDLKGHTFSRTGSPVTSTAQFKFGTASAFFPSSLGNLISTPDSNDWSFGAGDWTVEFHGYGLTGASAQNGIVIGQADGMGAGSASWMVGCNGTYIGLQASTGSGSWNIANVAYGMTTSVASWAHYAFCGQGTTLRLYVDGEQKASGAITGGMPNSTRALTMGRGVMAGNQITGYLDNVRITKGVCRYPDGTTFAPPTAAYPTS